jgi:hypothetical protein
LKGFKSGTRLYRVAYDLIGPLLPLLTRRFPHWVTTPERLGRAIIRAAGGKSPKNILEAKDIHELGEIIRT